MPIDPEGVDVEENDSYEGEFSSEDDPLELEEEIRALKAQEIDLANKRKELFAAKREQNNSRQQRPSSETGYKPPVRRNEKPIAVTANGKPVFAFNENGIPICNALRTKTAPDGSKYQDRCRNPILGPSGRCRMHNGWALKGIEHGRFKTGEYATFFEDRTLGQLINAATDPDYLDLSDELALNFVQITKILNMMSQGYSENSLKQIQEYSEKLEKVVFSSKMENFVNLIGHDDWQVFFKPVFDIAEKLVVISRKANSDFKAYKQLNECLKVRKTLIDTELKRKQMEQNNISSNEMLSLFGTLCTFVMQIFGNYQAEMEMFAAKLDEMALHPVYRNASNAKAFGGRKFAPIPVNSAPKDQYEPIIDGEFYEEGTGRPLTGAEALEGQNIDLSKLKPVKIKIKLANKS